jgi:hypothetical protein
LPIKHSCISGDIALVLNSGFYSGFYLILN